MQLPKYVAMLYRNPSTHARVKAHPLVQNPSEKTREHESEENIDLFTTMI